MTSERVKKTFYHQGLSPLMHAHVTSVSGHILPTVQGLLIFPATPLRILCVCDLRVMGVPEFPWLCQSGLSLQCGHLESRLSNAGFVELAAVSCSPRHLIKFSIHGLQLESSLFSSRCPCMGRNKAKGSALELPPGKPWWGSSPGLFQLR